MEVEIRKILEDQFQGGTFARLDIFVRALVVEDLLEQGDGFGPQMYRKMYKGLFPNRKFYKINERLHGFADLVEKSKKDEFDLEKYPIHLTNSGKLWDGSHRLSIAIARKDKTVNIKEVRKEFRKGILFTKEVFKPFYSEEDFEWLLYTKDYYFKHYEVNKDEKSVH